MDINNHLEKEWKEYKRKPLYASPIILGTLAVAIVVLAYIFLFTKDPSSNTEVVKKSPEKEVATKELETKEEVKKEPQTKQETQEKKVVKKKSTVFLEPSFQFEKDLKEAPLEKKVEEEKIETEQESKEVVEEKREASNQEVQEEIVIEKSTSNTEELIEIYNRSPSYAKAVVIATKYYNEEKYQEAIEWSLTANEIDSLQEDSWIIFAKANRAIGKVEVALKAIDSYLEENDSQELKEIKEEIFQ